MSLPNVIAKVEKAQNLPVALVIGGERKIGSALCDILRSQNLQVVTDNHPSPDYIFQLSNKNTKNLLDLAVRTRAKFLLVTESQNSEAEKLALEYAKDYNLRVVIAQINPNTLDSPVSLASGLATLMFRPDTDGKIFPLGSPGSPKIPRPNPRFRFPSKIFLAVLILLMLIVFPVFAVASQAFFGLQALRTTKHLLVSGQFAKAAGTASSAASSFAAAKNDLRKLSGLIPIEEIYKTLDIAEDASDIAYHLSLAAGPLAKFFLSVVNLNTAFDISSALNAVKPELDQINTSLDFLSVKIQTSRLKPYLDFLPMSKNLLTLTSHLLPYIPDLVGVNGRRTYLVLLQNNTELRPGGGFIGSYGLVVFDKGKLMDFKIFDVYSADGQLRGKVNPPDEILHYLGQPNWYLRDSNWSPDFALSAKRAAWFLEKETGVVVDGVIGLDLYFVQKLLTATGPLKLNDFDDVISAENFFQKAESQAEINFFPGSTQKRDYLSAAASALFNQLTANNPKNLSLLLPAILQSLEEKHLQIYIANPKIEQILASPQTEVQNKLFLVEANLGANKANYYINRQFTVQTDLGKSGELDTTLTVTYQNNSPGDVWPAGRYKNYLRLFVPYGSQLLAASVGDNRVATASSVLNENVLRSLPSDQFLVFQSSESGMTTFGTLLEIPANTRRILTFKYRPPQTLDYQQTFLSYNFAVLKQAGTGHDPLSVIVNFPPFLKAQDPLVPGGQIRYNTNLSKDKTFNIIWKKSL